jgi:UDP-N-acetylmuramate dehydrogenase
VLFDVPLAPRTTFQVGGVARRLAEVDSERDLIDAVAGSDAEPGGRCLLLGGGSNVLIADDGWDGLVIAIKTRGILARDQGERVMVTAAAGEPWDNLVAFCVAEGLAGVECLSGIPGLVGATPIQNVGAYGQEVSDTLVSVRAYDRSAREVVELPASACDFRYRDSAFKSRWPGRFVVLAASFSLRRGPPALPRYAELATALGGDGSPSLGALRELVVALRRKKSMVLDPEDDDSRGAGSFFTNAILDDAALAELRSRLLAGRAAGSGEPPLFDAGPGLTKVPAAWLIERAGFPRGTTVGAVGVSRKHALALVNRGGATAAQVVALAGGIQRAVFERFGVWLEPEPVLVGFAGDPLARGA